MKLILKLSFLLIILSVIQNIATAQEAKLAATAQELAKKLANPLASLLSVPFQNNTDVGIGAHNGSRNTMNFQPLIPIKLNSKLNLITRVIIPIISQQNIGSVDAVQSGIADATVSGFIAPAEPKNGFSWGGGPIMLLPIATNDIQGGKKLAVGPTAMALKQGNGWTVGALINQVWSVAGDNKRIDVSRMCVQQFTIYGWKSGAGVGLISEWTQNWVASTSTLFITPQVSSVTRVGKQAIQLLIGPRFAVAAPSGNKADFGLRASLILVFPR